ncbi:DUF2617 family protein [Halomicrobium katesii]|uniref:DUF2617 family protein n=1 Tax=Halomicrobium katesii TaxID=437163 RepID=UPI0003686C3D|nr:DUF2617 family protein [Halomicrobium katesii]
MNHELLHFGYELTDPDRLNVYDETTVTVDGVDFAAAVIGSSHCVRARSLGFAEIASCDERTVTGSRAIDLRRRDSATVAYDTEQVACTTEIRVDSIERFPTTRSFDLRYDFSDRAVTAVDAVDGGYETWHTYPEHDCAVFTETLFERLGRRPETG